MFRKFGHQVPSNFQSIDTGRTTLQKAGGDAKYHLLFLEFVLVACKCYHQYFCGKNNI